MLILYNFMIFFASLLCIFIIFIVLNLRVIVTNRRKETCGKPEGVQQKEGHQVMPISAFTWCPWTIKAKVRTEAIFYRAVIKSL